MPLKPLERRANPSDWLTELKQTESPSGPGINWASAAQEFGGHTLPEADPTLLPSRDTADYFVTAKPTQRTRMPETDWSTAAQEFGGRTMPPAPKPRAPLDWQKAASEFGGRQYDAAEIEFQRWYAGHSKRLGLNPDPDAPDNFYDYRSAYAAGKEPTWGGMVSGWHWPSEFKKAGHPNEVVGGFSTITGKRVPGTPRYDYKALVQSGWEPATALELARQPEPTMPDADDRNTLAKEVGDYLITGTKGSIAISEAAVGLADMLTAGHAGRVLEDTVGFRPGEAKQILDTWYSKEQQQRMRSVDEADGVLGKLIATLENPSVIAHTVLESLPLMAAGGVAARALPFLGAWAPAASEGLATAGSAAETSRQQDPEGLLTLRTGSAAAAAGLGTTLLGRFGGKLAEEFGVADVDTLIAAGAASPTARRNLATRVVLGAISEGGFEELPQSVQEQVLANIAAEKNPMEGVDQAAVLGALSGAVMGGAANILPRRPSPTDVLKDGIGGISTDILTKSAEEAATAGPGGLQAPRVEPPMPGAPAGAVEIPTSLERPGFAPAGTIAGETPLTMGALVPEAPTPTGPRTEAEMMQAYIAANPPQAGNMYTRGGAAAAPLVPPTLPSDLAGETPIQPPGGDTLAGTPIQKPTFPGLSEQMVGYLRYLGYDDQAIAVMTPPEASAAIRNPETKLTPMALQGPAAAAAPVAEPPPAPPVVPPAPPPSTPPPAPPPSAPTIPPAPPPTGPTPPPVVETTIPPAPPTPPPTPTPAPLEPLRPPKLPKDMTPEELTAWIAAKVKARAEGREILKDPAPAPEPEPPKPPTFEMGQRVMFQGVPHRIISRGRIGEENVVGLQPIEGGRSFTVPVEQVSHVTAPEAPPAAAPTTPPTVAPTEEPVVPAEPEDNTLYPPKPVSEMTPQELSAWVYAKNEARAAGRPIAREPKAAAPTTPAPAGKGQEQPTAPVPPAPPVVPPKPGAAPAPTGPTVVDIGSRVRWVLTGAIGTIEEFRGKPGGMQEALVKWEPKPGTTDSPHNRHWVGLEGLSANLEAPPKPKGAAPPSRWTAIGQNADGQTVYQDADGVRSVVSDGVRQSEAVSIIPGGGVMLKRNEQGEPTDSTYRVAAAKPGGAPTPAPKPEPAAPPPAAGPAPGSDEAKLEAERQKREELREKLRKKLEEKTRTVSSGLPVDPEMISLMVQMVQSYITSGFIEFRAAWRQLKEDMGRDDAVALTPYFEEAWDTLQGEYLKVADLGDDDAETTGAGGTDGGQLPVPGGGTPLPGGEGTEGAPGTVPTAAGEEPAGEGGTGPVRPEAAAPHGLPHAPGVGENGPGAAGTGTAGAIQGHEIPASGATADPGVAPPDYTLTPEKIAAISGRGAVERARDNVEAIRIIKEIARERRHATVEEQDALAKYVGWGATELAEYLGDDVPWRFSANQKAIRADLFGLTTPEERARMVHSTLNAHYTYGLYTPIWNALSRFGFAGGRVIEPAIGIGHAIGLMPPQTRANSTILGVELDTLSAAIAAKLYPSVTVQANGYEQSRVPSKTQDLVISNVPFGDIKILDAKLPNWLTERIHNYFFVKALSQVRDGGYIVFITSKGTLDAQDQMKQRRHMMGLAHFVGAVRLPGGDDGAFAKTAKTEVVTDIVILQKRLPTDKGPSKNADQFIKTQELWRRKDPNLTKRERDDPANDIVTYRSSWFTQHPELVLGTEDRSGTMYQGGGYNVTAPKGQTPEQLAEAIEKALNDILPENGYVERQDVLTPEQVGEDAGAAARVGEFQIINGQLMQVNRDKHLVLVPETTKRIERFKGLIAVRDLLGELITLMRDRNSSPEVIEAGQARLQDAYDRFVGEFGILNSRSNRSLFRQDPRSANVRALEVLKLKIDKFKKPDGKWGKKIFVTVQRLADIFTKRTINAPRDITKADSPLDALLISLGARTYIDWSYMAKLTGQTEDELQEALSLDGMVYETPDGSWVMADEYLSGDVVTKLADAHAAEMGVNVKALEAVQPTQLTPGDFAPGSQHKIALGTHWVEPTFIRNFLASQLGIDPQDTSEITTVGTTAIVTWNIAPPPSRQQKNESRNHPLTIEYGPPWTEDEDNPLGTGSFYEVVDMLDDALNLAQPTKYWNRTEPDGSVKRIRHEKATLAARANIEALKDMWVLWQSEPEQETMLAGLVETYNARYNRTIPRKYDGKHLQEYLRDYGLGVVGKDGKPLELHPHQLNGIWRILTNGNTLLAHEVGAGKTFEVIIAAMEMRRTGRARKPMITVPTQLLGQWRAAIGSAYPAAKVAMFDETDLAADKRQEAMSQIALGDWDIVLVPHSSFELLEVSNERQIAVLQELVDEIMEAELAAQAAGTSQKKNVKALERMRNAILKKIATKMAAANKGSDDNLVWEDLGVDALLVDEAHSFKNLFFYSQMDRIRGLSKSDADKALDMWIKVKDINESSDYRNIVFATATPVMNSMVEVFAMQRYLQPQLLAEMGMQSFDNWYRMFGNAINVTEQKPDGSYHQVMRIAEFSNLRLLYDLFSRVSDYVGWKDMPYLKLPKLRGGTTQTVTTEPHPMYDDVIRPWLAERLAEIARNPPHMGPNGYVAPIRHHPITGKSMGVFDNILTVMNDAKLAAIDIRLVLGEEHAEDFEGSRLQTVARDIYKEYDETREMSYGGPGMQLVFIDTGTPKPPIEMLEFLVNDGGLTVEEGEEIIDEAEEDPNAVDPDKLAEGAVVLYDALKKELIKQGIKSAEIAFVHQAQSPAERVALFEAARDGRIRVLIGSTDKGGVGMDVQDRMTAIRHFDAPRYARPGDLQQRLGRGMRQGNLNEELLEVRYVTKGTTDEWLYGMLALKSHMVQSFMRGEATGFTEPDPSTISIETARALATKDPRRFEWSELKSKLVSLSAQAGAAIRTLTTARQRVGKLGGILLKEKAELKKLNQWLRTSFTSLSGKRFSMKVGPTVHQDRKAANDDLMKRLTTVADEATGKPVQVGVIGGAWGAYTSLEPKPSKPGGIPTRQVQVEGKPQQRAYLRAAEVEEASAEAVTSGAAFVTAQGVPVSPVPAAEHTVEGQPMGPLRAPPPFTVPAVKTEAKQPTGLPVMAQYVRPYQYDNEAYVRVWMDTKATGGSDVTVTQVDIPRRGGLEGFGLDQNVVASLINRYHELEDRGTEVLPKQIASTEQQLERATHQANNPLPVIAEHQKVVQRIGELEAIFLREGEEEAAEAAERARRKAEERARAAAAAAAAAAEAEKPRPSDDDDDDADDGDADMADRSEGGKKRGGKKAAGQADRPTSGTTGTPHGPRNAAVAPPAFTVRTGRTHLEGGPELPELIAFVNEAMGGLGGGPDSVKATGFRGHMIRGMFNALGRKGMPLIQINRYLFRSDQADQLARTIAHEIGHWIDWIPGNAGPRILRGNILGRLKSLRGYLRHTYTAADGTTIKNADVKKELKALSAKWRPWDRAASTPSFQKYRDSAVELYADALSVLINDPALLKRDAPIFFDQFLEHLDSKPDVEAAYLSLMEILGGTPQEIADRRMARQRQMFDRANAKAREVAELADKEKQLAQKSVPNHLLIEFVDKNWSIVKRTREALARGTQIPPERDASLRVAELRHIVAEQSGFLQRTFQPIRDMVFEAGISWNDFGIQLFNERIAEGDPRDRGEIANPQGITAEAARATLERLRETMTGPQRRAMDRAVALFRDAVGEIAQRGYQAGLYTDKTYQSMQNNPAYASFRVIDYMWKAMTPTIHHQKGTLNEIQNPADATMLKLLVTIRAIDRNLAVRDTEKLLAETNEVEPAKQMWVMSGGGKPPHIEFREPPNKSGKELLVYKVNGKNRGIWVPEEAAWSINNQKIGEGLAALKAVKWANKYFRKVFTSLNLGFQLGNFLRDFQRYWYNIPQATLRSALTNYYRAVPIAVQRSFGKNKKTLAYRFMSDDARKRGLKELAEMTEAKILGMTWNEMYGSKREFSDTQLEETFALYQVEAVPGKPRPLGIPRGWLAMLDFIDNLGTFIETLPKAAAVYEYIGEGRIEDIDAKTRAHIRENVGSPDFLQGGTLKPITNELFLFSNAIVLSIRADYRTAFKNTDTRGAFWRKAGLSVILPVVLSFIVENFAHMFPGGSGDEPRDWKTLDPMSFEYVQYILKGASDYDKANYHIIPLGLDAHGNSKYLRLPRSDSGRMVGGVLYKLLNAAKGDVNVMESAMQLVAYVVGQAPGLTPAVSTAADVVKFASGRQIYDSFRDKEVFTRDEMDEGVAAKLPKFLSYEFQNIGGGLVYKIHTYDRPEHKTGLQTAIELPIVSNIAGRFLRVTNYGHFEELRAEVIAPIRAGQAKTRRLERDAVGDALAAYSQLPPPNRNARGMERIARKTVNELYADASDTQREAQYRDVLSKMKMGAARGAGDQLTELVMAARTTDERVALIKETHRDIQGRRKWLLKARAAGVISEAVEEAVSDDMLREIRLRRRAQ